MSTFSTLSPDTRVWVYQANEPFMASDLPELEGHLQNFAQQWVSHNTN